MEVTINVFDNLDLVLDGEKVLELSDSKTY